MDCILVNSDTIKLVDVVSKLNLKSDSAVERFRLLINNFNHPSRGSQVTYQCTRPIFSKNKKYAFLVYNEMINNERVALVGFKFLKYSNDEWKTIFDFPKYKGLEVSD